jgi:NAD(P)-dependent dehydrogenase (short-subunit alcohol dehydrogenase family)
MDVNLRGVFAGARQAARHMIKIGRVGTVVSGFRMMSDEWSCFAHRTCRYS